MVKKELGLKFSIMRILISRHARFSMDTEQEFIHGILPKISDLREIINSKKLNLDIAVDGGINPVTAKKVIEAGANILAAASAIFKSDNYKETIKKLKNPK